VVIVKEWPPEMTVGGTRLGGTKPTKTSMTAALTSLGCTLVQIPGIPGRSLCIDLDSDVKLQSGVLLPLTGTIRDVTQTQKHSDGRVDWTPFNSYYGVEAHLDVDKWCVARWVAAVDFGYPCATFVQENCKIKYGGVDHTRKWQDALEVPSPISLEVLDRSNDDNILYWCYGGSHHFPKRHGDTIPAWIRHLLDFYITSTANQLPQSIASSEDDARNFFFLTIMVISAAASWPGVMSDEQGDTRLKMEGGQMNKAKHVAVEHAQQHALTCRADADDPHNILLQQLATHYSAGQPTSKLDGVTLETTSKLLPDQPVRDPFAKCRTIGQRDKIIDEWTLNVTFAVLAGRALGQIEMVLLWLKAWNTLMQKQWATCINDAKIGSDTWYNLIYFACHPVLALAFWGNHLQDWGFPGRTNELRYTIDKGIECVRTYTVKTWYTQPQQTWKAHPDATWELLAHELLLLVTDGKGFGKPYQEMFCVMLTEAHAKWLGLGKPLHEQWLNQDPVFKGKANNKLTTYYHARVLAVLCLSLVMKTRCVDACFDVDDIDVIPPAKSYTVWCVDVVGKEARLLFKRAKTSNYTSLAYPLCFYAFPEQRWPAVATMHAKKFKLIRDTVVVFVECPDGEVCAVHLPWSKFNGSYRVGKKKQKWIVNDSIGKAFLDIYSTKNTDQFMTSWTDQQAQQFEELVNTALPGDNQSLLAGKQFTKKQLCDAYVSSYVNLENPIDFVKTAYHKLVVPH
jgi:hypothetical protein